MFGSTMRAKSGARLLDANHPGWADKIQTDILDLKTLGECMLAQLYGDYAVGVRKLGNGAAPVWAFKHGFFPLPGNDARVLKQAWITEINARRSIEVPMKIAA